MIDHHGSLVTGCITSHLLNITEARCAASLRSPWWFLCRCWTRLDQVGCPLLDLRNLGKYHLWLVVTGT